MMARSHIQKTASSSATRRTKPLFHHCTDLKNLRYDVIYPAEEYTIRASPVSPKDLEFDQFYLRSFKWWQKRAGFYPLFLAVGDTLEDIRMTGYDNQWRRIISSRGKRVKGRFKTINTLRKAGTYPNYVLLSFDDVDGIYTDYDAWHIVLNEAGMDKGNKWDMKPHEFRQLTKPSYNKADWLRKARKEPHHVQLVTPYLDCRRAVRVWVRNLKTKRIVEAMGFRNVHVKRLRIYSY